jgi:dihydrofolate reductase
VHHLLLAHTSKRVHASDQMLPTVRASGKNGHRRTITIVDAEKLVLSDKFDATRWPRTSIAHGPMLEAVTSLKSQPGADIICFGGVGFASALMATDVVDEVQLYINPFAVGSGKSIFGVGRDARKLALVAAQPYACGIVVTRYRPGGRGSV